MLKMALSRSQRAAIAMKAKGEYNYAAAVAAAKRRGFRVSRNIATPARMSRLTCADVAKRAQVARGVYAMAYTPTAEVKPHHAWAKPIERLKALRNHEVE